MLGLETWGTVIGIIFIYLLLSLFGTIINEWVMMLLNARGKNLLVALETMLSDGKKENKNLIEAFKKNPRFTKLRAWGKGPRLPSYLNADTFAKIVIDELTDGDSIKDNFDQVEAKINEYFPHGGDTKELLTSMIRQTGENLEEFESELISWYDDVMSRASGWYKRQVKYMLLLLGMIISIVFNADTFAIIKVLSSNPEARDKVVAQAEEYITKQAMQRNNMNTASTLDPNQSDLNLSSDEEEVLQEDQVYRDKIDSLYTETNSILNEEIYTIRAALGMGWDQARLESLFNPWYNIFISLLGWFLTAFAISLGAPFWFDLLLKVTDVRSAGKASSKKE